MRETEPSPELATQTAPPPIAMPAGGSPTAIGAPAALPAARIDARDGVVAEVGDPHRTVAGRDRRGARSPAGVVRVTRSRRGSIRDTSPTAELTAQTAPSPTATSDGPARGVRIVVRL